MIEDIIRQTVEHIFVEQFNVSVDDFNWNEPIVRLNEEFKIVGVLLDLETSINDAFGLQVSLIEEIDIDGNTPSDIVNLVYQQTKETE